MKQAILFVALLTVSMFCYANTASPLAEKLGTAWKTQQSLHAKEDKNDITIVYGGADISAKPSLTFSSTLA